MLSYKRLTNLSAIFSRNQQATAVLLQSVFVGPPWKHEVQSFSPSLPLRHVWPLSPRQTGERRSRSQTVSW